MTVAELIALLENEDADAPIVVDVEGTPREISHVEALPQDDGEIAVHVILAE